MGKYLSNMCMWLPLHGWRVVWCTAARINSEQVRTFPRALLCIEES